MMIKEKMSLRIVSIIDDDITINEAIDDNFYEYVKNIVDTYSKEHKLVITAYTIALDVFIKLIIYESYFFRRD